MGEALPSAAPTVAPADTQQRLRRLLDANRSIVSELSLSAVLRRIVEAARDLASARYAALGVIGDDGTLEEFIHVGVDDAIAEAIGQQPMGLGVLGALFREPGTIRLSRVSDDNRFGGFPDGHPLIGSFLGVPIQVPGAIFGNLYLADREGGDFTAEDEDLVLGLAATAGIAIENARLYEESRHRQEWLRARAEVARTIAASEQQTAMEIIAESVLRLSGADSVSVVHPVGQDGVLEVATAVGQEADRIQGVRYERAGSAAAAAIQHGSGLLLADASSYQESSIHPDCRGRLGAVMALPLATEHGVSGAVVAGRALGKRPFTASDLEMAESFATAGAIAMELAQARRNQERLALFEERERIARDLHDHVIQRLFATGLRLQMVAEGSSDGEVRNRLAGVVTDVDETIRSLRTAISTLREEPAVGSSLRAAVMSVVNAMTPVLPDRPDVIFAGPLDAIADPELLPDVEAVVREALSNVARHANARRVSVRVEVAGRELEVRISDDGSGILPGNRRSGLTNLRRRARQYGGTSTVTSPEHGGTSLSWTIPVEL